MASSHNVELEAAKFLHKLIQDSKDEPAKLAAKLYVILQHMKSSGKEHSMPYQVISRAMETVINQHGIDIEALKSPRLPVAGGTQTGDSATTQFGGPSQVVGVPKDSRVDVAEDERSKIDQFGSSRPPVGPSSGGHEFYQGPGTHRSSQSFDHESPSSLDSRSANSQSQERRDTANWDKQVNKKESKKTTSKRKRGDTSVPLEPHNDNPQQLDARNTVVNPRKGKLNKVEPFSGFSGKGGEHTNFNILPSGGQVENFPSLSGSMRPVIRSKQEAQHFMEKQLDSTNISNSMSRAPNSKYLEELEVSSTHSPSAQQQVGSLPPAHDVMGVWNQNKTGVPFEQSQVPRFPSNAVPGNMTAEIPMQQTTASSIGLNPFGKVHGGVPVASSPFPVAEPGFSSPMQFGGALLSAGKVLEHDGGSSNMLAGASKLSQGARENSVTEISMHRSAAPRDTGKSPVSSGMPFKEQQLKQLRAQCLVFLAFRNGMMPKKLHLEIALGNIFPKEGSNTDGPRKELIDHKGKAQSSNELNMVPEVGRLSNARETDKVPPGASSTGRFHDTESLSKEAENSKMEDKSGPPLDHSVLAEERKLFLASRKPDAEMQAQDTKASQASLAMATQQNDTSGKTGSTAIPGDNVEGGHLQVGKANQAPIITMNRQMNPEMFSWTGVGNPNDISRGRPLPASTVQHEFVPARIDNACSQGQNLSINSGLRDQHTDNNLSSFPVRDRWKLVSGIENDHHTVLPMKDVNMMQNHVLHDDSKVSDFQNGCFLDGQKVVPVIETLKNGTSFTAEQVEENNSVSTDFLPSPKYTMSEKWIMGQQKKKLLEEQKWILKQQKTNKRIAVSFHKLKDKVSSSEDISAKTKSVIELKKLQLLELQRRLRSDFLNDFFRPITTEMDRLKSFKKHRHGRRIKQLEKFEQKMKEERQKRIRERQKEFFSEIEMHKEKLDDVFKFKRERWKGFNKYVKEFHKRKERIHREKIDRIQREKINLLKINDVEGYLRMVQDAKSDRVKQLLKETEKYLQKLGSKLQEAKTVASRFEHDMDETETANVVEKSDTIFENEDESDQAKHYMESNEKYYLMAHSIKESIAEQPSCLQNGKLREYQMNGLRWLVSLYNNHLNGILADEMGLGKTVQVIALICYLMETKNDRGPFLVVVPSSVLPGWESEINIWAPSIHKIVYAGPPEERRRLFKEKIVHRKFNVLLTTYEYLMNKHDRPKLSKVHWHYIIIDEGHRIKNASCKLNADLKHYQSSHRLLLTGTPLQNNLEELWALLNFLLPNIFNSSEDFSQWFNKPFESNGDNSADQALLSEEENLLIINRLHQVLRPFVLRRLKHKVENQLPEKIERLVRCEASAYQKLLMKRVEENLGQIGSTKSRSVHNSVMELRNICNHPYLSQLHAEEVNSFIPKHYLPTIIRLCGKLEMLDRLLPKLKATDHRVLFFSTMTRLLDLMEEYLNLKQYRYLRLDGQTSGSSRGALIDQFNKPNSPIFIFLLSIRAGGVGVNLQAADTVIIFDTDWNPQVDLQAQARAHRIGQKRDVLVLRFETVQTVEEQVRASAEHKLGVANQSITAGFFDNNTSAEDRREYLESLLRECKKEEAAPVLDDDALNDLLARSESEIDVFESVDKQRQETEMATWRRLICERGMDTSEPLPPLPSRLVTDDDLKEFYEAMKIYEEPKDGESNVGVKRKAEYLGGLDTQHYGRGKRAREVRSYEEQWTEEEFEKLCQVDSPDSYTKAKEEAADPNLPSDASRSVAAVVKTEVPAPFPPQQAEPPLPPLPPQQSPLPPQQAQPPPPPVQPPPTVQPPHTVQPPPTVQLPPTVQPSNMQQSKDVTPPAKRGRGRPKRATTDRSPTAVVHTAPLGTGKVDLALQRGTTSSSETTSCSDSLPGSGNVKGVSGTTHHIGVGVTPSSQPTTPPSATPGSQNASGLSAPSQVRGQGRKSGGEAPRRRGKKQGSVSPAVTGLTGPDPKPNELSQNKAMNPSGNQAIVTGTIPVVQHPDSLPGSAASQGSDGIDQHHGVGIALNSPQTPMPQCVAPVSQSSSPCPSMPTQMKAQSRKTQSGVGATRRRGKKQALVSPPVPDVAPGHDLKPNLLSQNKPGDSSESQVMRSKQDDAQEPTNVACHTPDGLAGPDPDLKSTVQSVGLAQCKQSESSSTRHDSDQSSLGPALGESQNAAVLNIASVSKDAQIETCSAKPEVCEPSGNEGAVAPTVTLSSKTFAEVTKDQSLEAITITATSTVKSADPVVPSTDSFASSTTMEGISKANPSVPPASQSITACPSEPIQVKRQGRKTPSRGETPRRRGKKQALTISAVPDGSAAQDSKLSSQSQNRSADTMASKSAGLRGKHGTDAQETNLNQAQISEVNLTSGLVCQDPQRKEQSSHTPPVKQLTNPSTTLDSSAGSSEKNSALGRIQTANVNDVARVMKEVFSGTCLSKNKNGESSGKEGRAALNLPVASKNALEVAKNQTSEVKAHSTMPILDTEASVLELPVKYEKHSEASVLDLPVKYEKHSATGADDKSEVGGSSVCSETHAPTTDLSKPEIKTTAGSVGEMADSKEYANEDAVVLTNTEAIYTSSLSAGERDDGLSQGQPFYGDPPGFSTGSSGNEVSSSLVAPSVVEPLVISNTSGNKTGTLEKESPNSSHLDDSGFECPAISMNTDKADDYPETTPPIAMPPENLGVVVTSTKSDGGSGNKMEPSVEELQLTCPQDVSSHEDPVISEKAEDVGEHHKSPISRSPDHSSVVESPTIEIHSGNEIEPALNESPKHSLDVGITENPAAIPANLDQSGNVDFEEDSSEKVVLPSMEAEFQKPSHDIGGLENPATIPLTGDQSNSVNFEEGSSEKVVLPSMEAEAAECSGEATVADSISLKADDLGVIIGPPDIALEHSTETLHEAPFEKIPATIPANLDQSGNVDFEEDSSEKVVLPSMEAEFQRPSHDIGGLENPATILVTGDQSNSVNFEVGSSEKVVLPSMEAEAAECSGEATVAGSISLKADDLGVIIGPPDIALEQSTETLHEAPFEKNPAILDQSSSVNIEKGSSEEVVLASIKAEFQKPSLDIGSLENPSTNPVTGDEPNSVNFGEDSSEKVVLPSMEVEAAVISGEAIVAGSKISSEGDRGAILGPHDVASEFSSETLNEALSEEGNLEATCVAIEYKEEAMLEPLKSVVDESGGAEVILKDQVVPLPQEIQSAGHNEACNMDLDPSEGDQMDVSHTVGTVSERVSDDVTLPSLLATTGEKVDNSERIRIGSSVELGEPKGSYDAESCDQLIVCSGDGFVPENISEALPSCSLVKEEEKIEGSKVPVGNLAPLEEPKDSEAEMDIQFDSTKGSETFPGKVISSPSYSIQSRENIGLPSEMGPDFGLVPPEEPKDSEAEMVVRLNSSNDTEGLPEKIVSYFSYSMVEDKIGGSSQQDPVCSSVPIEESKDSEADGAFKHLEGSKIQENVHTDSSMLGKMTPENTSSDDVLPPSSFVTDEAKIESSLEKGLVSPLMQLEGSEGFKAKMENGVDAGQDVVGSPGNMISETMDPPSSSLVTEEGNVEGVQLEGSKGFEAKFEHVVDAGHDVVGSPENLVSETIDLPSSSLVTMEGKIEDVQLEGSNGFEAKMENAVDASQDVVGSPENMVSETMDLPSSSLVTEEEKIEGSANKGLYSSPVTFKESKDSDVETVDDTSTLLVGGILPGSTLENMNVHLSPLATEDTKTAGSPERHLIGSSVEQAERKGFENDVDDQIDVSQVVDILHVNLAETMVPPSSSPAEKDMKIEDSSMKDHVVCSMTMRGPQIHEAGVSDKIDASCVDDLGSKNVLEKGKGLSVKSQVGISVPLNDSNNDEAEISHQMDATDKPRAAGLMTEGIASEKVDQASSSLETQEEKIEGSSKINQMSSLEVVVESKGSEIDDQMDASKVSAVVPNKYSLENIVQPEGSTVMEQKKIEGLFEDGVVGCLVVLKESKGSPAEMGDQVDVSQDRSMVAEVESENMDQPPPSSVTEGDDADGSSEMELVGNFAVPEESESKDEAGVGVAPPVCETLLEHENAAPGESESKDEAEVAPTVCETLLDCENSVAPEESESKDDAGVAPPVCETLLECENKDLPPSSSVQEGEKFEGSSQGGELGSLVDKEEIKGSEVE